MACPSDRGPRPCPQTRRAPATPAEAQGRAGVRGGRDSGGLLCRGAGEQEGGSGRLCQAPAVPCESQELEHPRAERGRSPAHCCAHSAARLRGSDRKLSPDASHHSHTRPGRAQGHNSSLRVSRTVRAPPLTHTLASRARYRAWETVSPPAGQAAPPALAFTGRANPTPLGPGLVLPCPLPAS